MKDKIKIDIVSDVVCPWCIIGYKRLEEAIVEMGIEDKVEIEWQPFELNPNMPIEGQNVQEHITEKYGSSVEDQKHSNERMAQFGKEHGFLFDIFDEMKMANTRDAHILLEFAKEFGKQTALNLRLVTAFFSEQKDISDREILIQEIENIGLNANDALARLENEEASVDIQTKEGYWQKLGISSVPTMVFNRKSALNGAQPVAVYKEVLTDLLKA